MDMTPNYLILLLQVGLINISATFSNHIKGLDDSILFHVNWPGKEDSILESPDYEKFEMMTIHNERFQCLVPINYGNVMDQAKSYVGPSAISLLMPIFKKRTCTLRLETYWSYELCHGQYIKQYHEEKDSKTSRYQEYNLGVLTYAKVQELEKELDESLLQNPNPIIPRTKIEGVDMPYLPVNYSEGSLCDLTGNPRISRVLYVCYEDGRHTIYSVKETYTCEYEIVILSSLLCQHPAYKLHDVPQTDLHCISMQPGIKRPKDLLHLEAESLKLRTHGAVVESNVKEGTIRIGVVDDDDGEDDVTSPSSEVWGNSLPQKAFPLYPEMDKELVEAFLNGEHCLHGNPSKKYRSGRYQISHLYSGGDECEAIGAPRQVEVKLRCKETVSPASVALYLLEPKTCEYILGVETSLVCPLLHRVDEFGLFPPNEKEIEIIYETKGVVLSLGESALVDNDEEEEVQPRIPKEDEKNNE